MVSFACVDMMCDGCGQVYLIAIGHPVGPCRCGLRAWKRAPGHPLDVDDDLDVAMWGAGVVRPQP